jgi:glycosyltransferase involved in cell wall biosynthesis
MNAIYSIGARLGAAGALGSVADRAAWEIQKRGHLKKVICWSNESNDIEASRVSAVFPFGKFFSRASSRFPYTMDNLYDRLASFQVSECDVFHGWNNHALFSMRKAKGLGAKTFIERASSHILEYDGLVREEYKKFGVPAEPVDRRVIKKCLQEYAECDYVLVPSEFAFNSFLEQGFDKEKLVKIPFGIDAERFRPGVKKDDVFRILFVGQMILRKGTQYLLEAFSELNLKNSELVLKGRIQREMSSIVEKYRVQNIKFVNWVDNLTELYNSASVFVFPSIEEGSALVNYEAMACGVPVITTYNSGSLVRDGKDGFVIPIRDVEAIKEKILYFYEKPGEVERMGNSARKRIEKYTWARYGNELCKAYERALE